MMKKIFAGLLLSGIAICHVSGQTALEGNKFSDNWSIGINVSMGFQRSELLLKDRELAICLRNRIGTG